MWWWCERPVCPPVWRVIACWDLTGYCDCRFHREAASNFLTALSLQRKSRSRQLSQEVMSGNIWAALRIALSMLDQPELFQAANIGDLDQLMRAFNLDMWEMKVTIATALSLTLWFISKSPKKPKCTNKKGSDLMFETMVFYSYVKMNCSHCMSHLGEVLRTGSSKYSRWLLCDGFALQFVISQKNTRTGKDCTSNALENTSIKTDSSGGTELSQERRADRHFENVTDEPSHAARRETMRPR